MIRLYVDSVSCNWVFSFSVPLPMSEHSHSVIFSHAALPAHQPGTLPLLSPRSVALEYFLLNAEDLRMCELSLVMCLRNVSMKAWASYNTAPILQLLVVTCSVNAMAWFWELTEFCRALYIYPPRFVLWSLWSLRCCEEGDDICLSVLWCRGHTGMEFYA